MRLEALAVLAAIAAGSAASAQPFIFGGYVEGRVGYVTNPFLAPNSSGGAASVGFTIAPSLTRNTSRGQTVITGTYDRDQYLSDYGYSETYGVQLAQTQQLTQHLGSVFHASYYNTNNATVNGQLDPLVADLFTVGQRSWRAAGDASFTWQMTARDQLQWGVNGTHVEYQGNRYLVSDYDQYGGQVAYLHQLDARTKVGANVSASRYLSRNFDNSSSIQPGLVLERQLSAAWNFHGDVGLILQKVDGDDHVSKGLGFHATLCGTHPRYSVCFNAGRDSTATGVGGLSTTLSAGASYSRQLSEHDTLALTGSYNRTSYQRSLVGGLDATFVQVSADYSHQLNQRLSVGAGAHYQTRELSGSGSDSSIGVTANIRMKIGRVS